MGRKKDNEDVPNLEALGTSLFYDV